MSPFDMLAQAQNGQVVQNLAQQYNLSQEQTEDAIQTMLPVLTRSLNANIQTRAGLSDLLRALSSGQHEKYYDDPASLTDPSTTADGDAILGHILGSDRQKRALATQASYATGIGGGLLEQLLPQLAKVLMGMLFKNGGPSIGRQFDDGGRGYSRVPDIQGFPRMPDTGGGSADWGDYTPQETTAPRSEPTPYDEIANEVSKRGRAPGGFSGGIRDAIGGMLGNRGGGGILGQIIKFVVLRYGWKILRGVIGGFLGGRR